MLTPSLAKMQKRDISSISETTLPSDVKILDNVWILKICSLLQHSDYDVTTNSRCRTTAILKIVISPISRSKNSAVAERPRDASCLPAVNKSCRIPRAQSFIISYISFTFTNFCSVLSDVYQSINQFNSRLAARELNSK